VPVVIVLTPSNLYPEPLPLQKPLHRIPVIPNPFTVDGVLREDQKELIMNADRLVDSISNLVADFHVLRGKPATDTFALKI